jgi:hypothetical protein
MEKHWERIYRSVALNELKKLPIKSYINHGKYLTNKQQERIDKRLEELYPYYEKFIELNGTDDLFSEDPDKIADKFSDFVRQGELGKKIRKIKGGIIPFLTLFFSTSYILTISVDQILFHLGGYPNNHFY